MSGVPVRRPPERTGPPKLTLVCFPHAGGGLSRYRGWRGDPLDGIDVVLPSLPGREHRILEEPFADAATVSRYVIDQLSDVIARSDRLAVAGLSYGAFVAFDMAARLEAAGRPVEALFLGSQRAPSTSALPIDWHLMDDDQLLASLIELGGLDRAPMDRGFLELFLPAIRIELGASQSYLGPAMPRPLHCPIFYYHGRDDALVSSSQARAWEDETSNFSWRDLEATHFLIAPDGTDLWLEALRKDHQALTGIAESAWKVPTRGHAAQFTDELPP